MLLFAEQMLNGVQFGIMLFLMAAGLTLIFGIMDFVNLTHGSLYMMGAFFGAKALQWLLELTGWTGSTTVTLLFAVAVLLGVLATVLLGAIIERGIFRRLYLGSHLDHVLATFGLLLFFNEFAKILFGSEPINVPKPPLLIAPVEILPGINYSSYRLAITVVGVIVVVGLYLLISRTRIGMLIRAGASNREMVTGLGININRLYTVVFALGAGLAGLAGIMTTPLTSVQVGIGEEIMILTFVVIVIGGIGSIRGAFIASIVIGIIDTIGRFLLPAWFGYTAGPALASMAIYLAMAAVLFFRPSGLFAAGRG
ncbi:MAG TPA: branched-chain amino acid ABC transporter permease [Alphaproteobacteria bacterium]|nr:branched-chain amino acid ABC transporter permease [Alphaproteobacteria bacterium]